LRAIYRVEDRGRRARGQGDARGRTARGHQWGCADHGVHCTEGSDGGDGKFKHGTDGRNGYHFLADGHEAHRRHTLQQHHEESAGKFDPVEMAVKESEDFHGTIKPVDGWK
jgi:hypothetical protein